MKPIDHGISAPIPTLARCSRVGLAVAVLLFAVFGRPGAADTEPKPASSGTCRQGAVIPPGFDFPASQARLQKEIANQDVHALRRHGWAVFAGMIQPVPGTSCQVWETWYDKAQTFSADPTVVPKLSRRITRLRQFDAGQAIAAMGIDPGKVPPAPRHPNGQAILSAVLYNRIAFDHIRDNKYYLLSTLRRLEGSIQEFPVPSVVIKPMWWPIAKTGYTPLPVWDNDPANPPLSYNGYETWKRLVAVDPTSAAASQTVNVTFPFNNATYPPKTSSARVVPLDSLYFYRLTQDDVAGIGESDAIYKSALEVMNRPLEAGDFIALVAMHVGTKEIPNWFWSTFWWHDGASVTNPNPAIARYAEDRPETLKGPWRNYLMDISFDMVAPKEPKGGPAVCINPYGELEVQMPGTIATNCTTCHIRAAYPSFLNAETWKDPDTRQRANVAVYDTLRRGFISPDDPLYRNLVKVDTLWSISDSALPDDHAGQGGKSAAVRDTSRIIQNWSKP